MLTVESLSRKRQFVQKRQWHSLSKKERKRDEEELEIALERDEAGEDVPTDDSE
jgi:hypothetical protein